jgi:hypothetical protein
LLSASADALFATVFTLAVSFWGRLALRACGARGGLSYGSPLPVCASLGSLALILRHVSMFHRGFEAVYTAFFLLGALGALAEGALSLAARFGKARKAGKGGKLDKGGDAGKAGDAWLHREARGRREARDPLDGPWPLAATAVAAYAFSLAFALAGGTGRPEPWISGAMDYYSWAFAADYWRGAVDPARYLIADPGAWFIDAFGQNVSMGLFSSSAGGFFLARTPAYSATVMAWTASALAAAARGATGLPRPLCLIAAAGALCGPLYMHLVRNGAFGHMLALFGLAALLASGTRRDPGGARVPPSGLGHGQDLGRSPGRGAAKWPGRVEVTGLETGVRAGTVRVFFPVLFLFMGYQAGFPVLLCLAAGIAALAAAAGASSDPAGASAAAGGGEVAALARASAAPDGGIAAPDGELAASPVTAERRPRAAARPAAAAMRALAPFALAALAACVLSPQTAAWTAGRLVSAASQVSGERPGFLSPALFSGIPVLGPGFPGGLAGGSAAGWAAALAGFLGLWAVGRGALAPGGRSGLDAMCALAVLSCFGYLGAYSAKGDSYQLWKLAAMTALPLSFLPAALACHAAKRAAGSPAAALALPLALLAAALFARAVARAPGEEGGWPRPLSPLISEVSRINREGAGGAAAVFDLSAPEGNMAALELSAPSAARELLAVKGAYFIPDHEDYLGLVHGGAAFYTDRDFGEGPYGSSFRPARGPFRLFRWDPERFLERGALSWKGFYRFTGDLLRPEASVSVMPPARLAGADAELSVTLDIRKGAGDPRCRRVIAAVHGPGGEAASGPSELDAPRLEVRIPAAAFRDGPATVRLAFPGFALASPEEISARRGAADGPRPPAPLFGTDPEDLLCDYAVLDAGLRAWEGGAAEGAAEGEAAEEGGAVQCGVAEGSAGGCGGRDAVVSEDTGGEGGGEADPSPQFQLSGGKPRSFAFPSAAVRGAGAHARNGSWRHPKDASGSGASFRMNA